MTQQPTSHVASELTVPVLRPLLPTAEQIRPYLERIDAARFYTNFGPLVIELEERLAAHFNVARRQLGALANGTTALSAALLGVRAKPGTRCILPAWTFVASAAAVWAANLTPYFVDCDPQTWTLDPQKLARRDDLADVGAVMVVSPFGAPIATQPWDEFTAQTGIPVVIDAAASFDAVASVPEAHPGNAPVMISLHATKAFGVGEGAIVLSSDQSVVHRIRQICNFGVYGSPEGQILGYNGKLSEYHAALGLAALDNWPNRRRELDALTQRYRSALAPLGVENSPQYGQGWVSSYCNVRTRQNGLAITDRLAYMGVETRRWWRDGVHAQPAYRQFGRDAVPVTDDLGRHVFGLPFFHDMTDAEFSYVIDRVAAALRAGDDE